MLSYSIDSVLNILLQIKVALFSCCFDDDGTKKQIKKWLDILPLKMAIWKTLSAKQLMTMW